MLGKTHCIAGAAAASLYICAGSHVDIPTMATAVAVGALGGLLPDIDHPNSMLSHKLKPVSKVVSLLFSHRGLFHTPFLYMVLYALTIWRIGNSANMLFINALFLGILSHLFLDALNPTGIPFFFPFEKRRRNLANIKTGSLTEKAVCGVLVCFICCTAFHFGGIV